MKKFIVLLSILIVFMNLAIAANPQVISFYLNSSANTRSDSYSPDIVRSSYATLQIITEKNLECKYSGSKGNSYSFMENLFDYSFETIHKKQFSSLNDGDYYYYVKCKNLSGSETSELGVKFTVITPVYSTIRLDSVEGSLNKVRKVILKTSKTVIGNPSLSYSFDGIVYNNLPLTGSGTDFIGYLVLPSSMDKDVVASFKFNAKDVEGFGGDEIKGDSVFLIDTIKPGIVNDVRATGDVGFMNIKWYYDEEYDHFNVYKSVDKSPDYVDFFKSVNGLSFTDSLVEKGKNYQYRISAVDKSGNEGDLSPIASGTVLSENSNSGGLAPELLGLIENFLIDIDSVASRVENAKTITLKEDLAKTIFIELELDNELTSVKSELESLEKEVQTYKNQVLTRNELDKKLAVANVKLSTLKKRAPESMIIVEEQEFNVGYENENIDTTLIELYPNMELDEKDKLLSDSLQTIKNKNLKSTFKGYKLDIVSIDGTRKQMSYFKGEITGSYGQEDNSSLILIVPKEIAQSSSEINVRKGSYNIIKEDPVYSFNPETKSISFSVGRYVDLELVKNLRLFGINKGEINTYKRNSPITGYFSLSGLKSGLSWGWFLIIIGGTVAIFGYFYFNNYYKKNSEMISDLIKVSDSIEISIKDDELDLVDEKYGKLSLNYSKLSPRHKKAVYDNLIHIREMVLVYKGFCKIKSMIIKDKQAATIEFFNLEGRYKQLDERSRTAIKPLYKNLKEQLKL